MSYKPVLTLLSVLIGIGLLLSACSSFEEIPETMETHEPEPALETSTPPNPTPEPEMSAISDDEATQLMYDLLFNNEPQKAVDSILDAEDSRFISVFIELMRANQIGLLRSASYRANNEALEVLSGKSLGENWFAWVEWYGTTSLTPPPGFTEWKGLLLAGLDPEFGTFLRNDLPSTIRVEEIMWGGVVVDGIPALKNATMIPADEDIHFEPWEPVFGISINGDHRAYPLRILDWHEMANDVVGEVPVSLAYCTLCGAGIAYDGRASNGETYTFGSSGFLYRSNKLMYDHQTRTLWNQLTGEPVLGELVDSGIKLDLLPVVLTSWESWLEQHPDTLVLDIDTGYQRPYLPGAAYAAYFTSDETMFPVWQRSNLLETKDRVYALQIEGIPKAYPVDTLIEELVVNDTIGETNLVLIATRGDITVQSNPVAIYNAGGEVRAYNREDKTFEPGPDPDTVLDSSGHPWQVTEEALVGPDGELAPRINGHLAYWFGWYSFFPQTLLYGEQ